MTPNLAAKPTDFNETNFNKKEMKMGYDKQYPKQNGVNRATLYKKKSAVMGRLSRIRESGRHQKQGWTYATAEDIKDAVREAMAAEGLSFSFEIDKEEPPQKDGKMTIVKLWFIFTIECGETGATQSKRIIGVAAGYDPDKVYYKAYTLALKYWLKTTLFISSGDDPDPDGDDNSKPPKKRQQKPQPKPKPEKLPKWLEGFYGWVKFTYGLSDEDAKVILKIGGVTGWAEAKLDSYKGIIDTQMSAPTNAPAIVAAANHELKRRQYENVHNLRNALRGWYEMKEWTFPAVGDDVAWNDVYQDALAYGKENPSDKSKRKVDDSYIGVDELGVIDEPGML
jgi:hypothetical protein